MQATFCLAIVLLCSTAFLVVRSRQELEASDSLTRQVREAQLASARVLLTIQEAETGQRGYLLTGNLAYLAPYEVARARLTSDLAQSFSTPLNAEPKRIEHVKQIGQLAAAKMAELGRTIALTRAGDRGAALDLVQTNEGQQLMEAIRAEDDALRADSEARIIQAQQRERSHVLILSGLALGLTVLASVLVVRFASARRLARRAQEQLARAFSLAQGMIRDPAGRITFWNEGAERLYGYSASEALGQIAHDLLRTTFPRPHDELNAELLRTGQWQGELTQRRRDGSELIVASHWALCRDPHCSPASIIEVNNDITALKRAEIALARHGELLELKVAERSAALLESERTLRLLIEGVVDYAIFMLDPDGHVKSWNPGAQRIKGYVAEEIIGRHFSCFYTQEDRETDAPRRALRAAANEGRFEDQAWRVRKDGTRFWANVVMDPIRDETGALIGYAKVTRDITAQRTAQLDLEEVQRRFAHAQKMEAVGQLTGGVAHDFNNLLQVVTGNVELARAAAQNGHIDRIDALLGNAATAIGRGTRLTGQLLSFSRRQTLRAERLLVSRLVLEMDDLIGRAIGETVHVEMMAQAGLWHTTIDPAQFESALLNLVINARDAIPRGGQISIRMSNASLEPDEVASLDLAPGDYVRVDVVDNGTGMPPGVLSRAFEPFFTTKEVGKGSGLGLAQVHGFARQSGGAARVISSPGQGTIVSLFFPRDGSSSATEGSAPENPDDSLYEAPKGTVLVVEDQPDVLRVTQLALTEAGHRVVPARNGEEALRVLNSDRPLDILVSDVVLPGGISGVEIAREARRLRPELPVLLASGYAGAVLTEHGAEGQFELLSKPFTKAELLLRLKKVMA